jgi:hypothetical protein
MQMVSICVCHTYADARHMDMRTYVVFSLFRSDPKTGSSGSASAPPARSGPETQDVAVFPADDDAICCVPPLPRDRPLTTGNGALLIP